MFSRPLAVPARVIIVLMISVFTHGSEMLEAYGTKGCPSTENVMGHEGPTRAGTPKNTFALDVGPAVMSTIMLTPANDLSTENDFLVSYCEGFSFFVVLCLPKLDQSQGCRLLSVDKEKRFLSHITTRKLSDSGSRHCL